MTRPRFRQNAVQVVGDLDHRRVRVVGQGERDGHAADLPVICHQPPGQVGSIERDGFDPRQLVVAQLQRVDHERPDDQVVLERLAMGVVCERVDPNGVGRAPSGLAELLYAH